METCTMIQTHNHPSIPPLSFLQAGCPSCCPTNSIKALKAMRMILLTLYIGLIKTGWQEGHPACKKTEQWSTGVVICLG